MRLSVVVAAVSLSIIGLSQADDVRASIKRPTNIPAQPLGPALQTLAKDRNFQVVYVSEEVNSLRTHGAVGEFTPEEALKQLLKGTGLTFRYLDEKTVTIVPVSAAPLSDSSSPVPASSSESRLARADGAQEAEARQKGFWSRFRLAAADQGASGSTPTVEKKNEQASDKKPVVLEVVVVTAQKREERLIDVPQSVSVLSADEIAKLGATQFRDFASTVPGLSFSTAGAGFTQTTLRGVTVGNDVSPTVGVYVDEVPYGSSTAFALSGQFALDAALFDLDRIEVLRGPQGTLYGASAMGGLIKYVTKRPDTTKFGGDVQTGISGTQDGDINYDVAGAINTPIGTDKVALRASGFESHDGGYVDNHAISRKHVNRSDTYGGRLDLLLRPIDVLAIRLSAFLQNISRDGEATADYTFAGAQPYGSLGQYRLFAEPFDQRFRIVSGTVTYDIDWAALTSISSYQTVYTDYTADISAVYVPLLNSFGFGPYGAVGYTNQLGTHKFAQEVRLASRERSRQFDWLIGGFYTHETSTNDQHFLLHDLAGLAAPNTLYTVSRPSLYKEYAAFGDLTWHLTHEFDVTGGVRYARNDQTFTQIGSGAFIGSSPTTRSSADVFTYLADARYHVSDHATAYLRYATGYRPGGPNEVTIAGGPATFASDRLKSYEAGFKAETSDGRFGIDLSGYYIDWSNIQLLAIRSGFGVYVNAPGGATVEGSELTVTARPIPSFTVAGAFAFQHAYLRQADADLGAAQGERLPNVPRFTAALNGDYTLPVSSLQPTVGATLRYVSDRHTSFDKSTSYPQYSEPGYTTVDLRTGLMLGSVNTQLYIHNLFDERGQLGILLPQFGARVAVTQPRTIGVTATTKF